MSDIQMHYLKQMKRLKYKITMARILLFPVLSHFGKCLHTQAGLMIYFQQSVPHYKNPVCNDF